MGPSIVKFNFYGHVAAVLLGAVLSSGPPSLPTMLREKRDKNRQASAQTRSITLSWKAPSPRSRKPGDVVKGYNVYRNVMSQDYSEKHRLNASPITSTQCVDTTVVPATTYFYSIRAVSQGGGQSDFSREIKVTVPAQK